MSRAIHPAAGAVALATIGFFWISTVLSELLGPPATVVVVKTSIPWGFVVLIPALLAAGASGFIMSRGRCGRLVDAKRKRMSIVALNGILILIPAALFLAYKARAGEFDAAFYGAQLVELIAGGLNCALLALNMRDGLRMKTRLPRTARA